jgi:hypothetical protein
MPEEVAIVGWKNIARMFCKSPTAMMRRRKELSELGVIFYSRQGPRPGRTQVCAFPSVLKVWATLKGQKGEMV